METSSKKSHPQHEQASLAFLKWVPLYEKVKPFQVFTNLPLGVSSTNLVFENEVHITLHNLKDQARPLTLEENGFQLCKDELKFASFDDVNKIEEIYLPKVKTLIEKHVQDAGRIEFFDWRVRHLFSQCSILINSGLRQAWKNED